MKVQVVAAILIRGDRFLLGKRAPHKHAAPDYWAPVSGVIEQGESEEQALRRECMEEVGVRVKPRRRVATMDNRAGTGTLYYWLVDLLEGEPRLENDEHTELRWLTVAEMRQLTSIFPEDIELYASLIS